MTRHRHRTDRRPHPNGQNSRQLGPLATVAVSFAIAVGLIAASGIIALALPIGG